MKLIRQYVLVIISVLCYTIIFSRSVSAKELTSLNNDSDISQNIKVTFTLFGDDIHDAEGEGNQHTLSMGTLQVWIPEKTYNIGSNATVKDLLEMALVLNHMTCSNPRGNYVQSITKDGVTLGEFDNGTMSGWMYTLNGKHPPYSVSQQHLSDGDVVVFHYTDEFNFEEGSTRESEAIQAKDVYDLIGKIGTVTYSNTSLTKITTARNAYDALSDDSKALITKIQYKILTNAEEKYTELKNYEDNKSKANDVITKINQIGTVTYTSVSLEKITTARNAYNALTNAQKALITSTHYNLLTGAEQKYQQLKAAAEKAAAEKKAAEEAKKAEAALIKKYTPVKTTLKSVKKAGSGKVKVTWKKITAATGYELYMSNSKTAGYKKIATIKKNKTVTYTKKGLKKKKTYYFKVRTYRKVGAKYYYGAYSNIKGLKLK